MSDLPTSPLHRLLCAIGNFFFRWRNTLFPVLFVAMALVVRPAHLFQNPRLDAVATLAGVLVALAGQIVRGATIGLAYIKRGGKEGRVYADSLVHTGVYAHTRNPMYLGNLLIAAGLCLTFGSPWMYGVVFPFFWFVYICIVLTEERYLGKQFGKDFEEYVRTVPRFWPIVKGLRATFSQYDFDWAKVLYKEYGTIFGTVAGLYVLLLLKYDLLRVSAHSHRQQAELALPLLAFIAAYAIARVIKKKRLLGPV
ncbi:MAG: isoprenylcysteine carboxylmethyltransferase family protein [Lentisphaerae bacterium]|nr:isoprenylcysteine carboxylmethyltransferase family protein [Lentisphaerota bacterium]